MPRRSGPVRIRLTLWFVLLAGGVLAGYLVSAMAILRWQLRGVVERLAVEDLETVEGLIYFRPDGSLDVHEDYHTHTQWRQTEQRYLEILGPDGRVLYRNDRLGSRTLGGPPSPREGIGGYSLRAAALSDGTAVIVASRRHALDGRPLLIRLAYGKGLYLHQWDITLLVLLLTLPVALSGLAFAGFKLAGWVFDPIAAIAASAQRITSQSLNERVHVGDEAGELADLAAVFNAMLGRIEHAFAQLRRFTADASHQLRAPLAALRAAGEVGLAAEASAEHCREVIGAMLEEIGRLNRLVEQLLHLSRADAGQVPLHRSRVDGQALAREVVSFLEVLADEKRLSLRLAHEGETLVWADPGLLRQALMNVIHNAIKFTPCNGAVELLVAGEDRAVRFTVDDSGPGIPTDDGERVFERFYRAPGSTGDGAGLGLAVTQWIVQAHGGTLGVSRSPAGGCRLWIRLPA